VTLYAGQMIKDNIEEFLSLFKIKGLADGTMQAIQLFLQTYNYMKAREGWDSLAEDVESVGKIEELPLRDMKYNLAAHIQRHTTMGVMSTNGQHRTGKGILVGENRKETTETHFWKIQMSCDNMYLTSYRCICEVSYINWLLLIFIIQSLAFGQRMSSQISRLTVPQRINR
jgi:hypothetical protein